ncbi:Adaptor protein complex AP-1 gamma subunit [Linderina pennispora]|uniref:AP-1 complex subunit gamma n=1 Tax=Linderina pennispora TaxID=61395 RepID=A0A1Y1WBC0_9FUNG|nr:Adaptor protein complex AP-1 gamma subunit [Linderina pennispora]ORX70840.1 Adaptor protein complex AP-1 gamma subunit [Linderina pennispora]
MSFFRLRDLIRAVRVCKTAADERNVIQRESAAIRTSFKEDNSQDTRYVNVQKLLYIYLLGFPVQFGQLECLKLAASSKFADKRVGYLGVSLLLDEKQEILTLLTNCLKSDMNNPDDYLVGLALCTLSNVASSEVANDLVDEVERLIDSSRSYLRKKAAMAAVRIPFLRRARSLLGDKHHGVQLAAVALVTEMCNHSQQALDEGRKLVPIIVRQLKGLLASTSSPEHEVGGIADPFLQVGILRLLRVAADELNDVLTQVATQTDGSKNVGTAILYECAVTALAIPSEQALRVLAINLLGKFLANRDNNVRYVALATLSTAVITEAPSVQRHRATVLQCLGDGDISIRRRALDLSFALINAQNVKPIVAEILKALPTIDVEFRPSMVYRLSAAVTLFGDSLDWRVETMLRVMRHGGKYLNARDMFKFIRLVAAEADETLQRRATRISFALLEQDISQEKMVIAGSWLIGEYADLLVSNGTSSAMALTAIDPNGELPEAIPEPADVVRLLAAIAKSPVVAPSCHHVALTALAKLSGRFSHLPAVVGNIRSALEKHTRSMDVETQARGAEFAKLLSSQLDSVRAGVVDRMPAPEYTDVPYEEYVLNPTAMRMKALTIISRPAIQAADLLGTDTDESDPAAQAAAERALREKKNKHVNLNALTATLLRLPSPSSRPDLNKEYEVYNADGLRITMTPSKKPKLPTAAISGLNFLVAVPKSQKLQILPPSSQNIAVGVSATQLVRVSNPTRSPIRLRMKLTYQSGSQNVDNMFDFICLSHS